MRVMVLDWMAANWSTFRRLEIMSIVRSVGSELWWEWIIDHWM